MEPVGRTQLVEISVHGHIPHSHRGPRSQDKQLIIKIAQGCCTETTTLNVIFT